jgi:hypothetical protein
MVDLKRWTEENVKKGWQNTIFDRHRLISEPIYGPILRDHSEPGFDDLHWFHSWLDEFYRLRPVLIYCLPPFEAVWRNVVGDEDNLVVRERATIRAIYGAYLNKAVTDHVLERKNVWIYDYTDPQFDPRSLIIHTIQRRVELDRPIQL